MEVFHTKQFYEAPQFNSVLKLESVQTPQVKGSVSQDCPHLRCLSPVLGPQGTRTSLWPGYNLPSPQNIGNPFKNRRWLWFSSCGLQSNGLVPGLQSTGSIVVTHGLSCFVARGIFPDQGSNPCLLHCQANSWPLSHQGSPNYMYCAVHCNPSSFYLIIGSL